MKYIPTIVTLALGLFIASCGGDPTDPGGRLSGKLSGSVELHTLDYEPITDASGVTVAVEGTAYGATTAADGTWHIDGLPAGTYTIRYSKTGFGESRMIGYQFTGGGEAFTDPVELGQLSTVRVTSLSAHLNSQVTHADSGGIDTISLGGVAVLISGTFSEPVTTVAAFFNSSPSIAPDSGRYNGVQFTQWPALTSVDNVVMMLIRDLRTAGYHSGDMVYMAIYTIGASSTRYYDPSRRKTIYSGAIPAVGSNVVSFTMP